MGIKNVFALCMLIAFVSLLGFAIENLWLCITKGFIDNRNMYFPFLFGYGLAMILVFAILGTPKKLWLFGKVIRLQNRIIRLLLYFIGVFICICVGEIILGTIVEKTCHFYWWDYTSVPMHITRYTSVPTSTMFSIIVTFFMDVCIEPLYFFFLNWNYRTLKMCAITLMFIMISDFICCGYLMYKNQKINRWLKIDTTNSWLYRKVNGAVKKINKRY